MATSAKLQKARLQHVGDAGTTVSDSIARMNRCGNYMGGHLVLSLHTVILIAE
jgi:hypothetical protein